MRGVLGPKIWHRNASAMLNFAILFLSLRSFVFWNSRRAVEIILSADGKKPNVARVVKIINFLYTECRRENIV